MRGHGKTPHQQNWATRAQQPPFTHRRSSDQLSMDIISMANSNLLLGMQVFRFSLPDLLIWVRSSEFGFCDPSLIVFVHRILELVRPRISSWIISCFCNAHSVRAIQISLQPDHPPDLKLLFRLSRVRIASPPCIIIIIIIIIIIVKLTPTFALFLVSS